MSRYTQKRQRIVILGGGTAGWITANTMIHRWADREIDITLVESPEIGTVGVGEGSTPRLKFFFESIDVAEPEWMPQCNATFKNGISFVNWSTKPGYGRYFHPFTSQIDQFVTTGFYFNTYVRRRGIDVDARPDRYFLSAHLSANRQGPKPDENFPFVVEYGYHFDAHLVGEFLKDIAKGRGVKHVQARVVEVTQDPDGDIASLVTDAGATIEGDFFIDCSGFRGTLIQKKLQVPFRSFAENLFNDSAVVLPTEQVEKIGSETVSTAMKHGWAWEIPLIHRIGNGYVYSSAFCSADEAETELRTHLDLFDSDTEARHLKMKVGRLEQHWHRNCLAVGLSQGFIEPLEATALNLVCNTVADFVDTVDEHGFNGEGRDAFNDRVSGGFEKVRDYIVAHYVLNSRRDTEYWRQNTQHRHLSDTLQKILEIWTTGKNLSQEIERQQIQTSYTAMSWYCLLSGYGYYPDLQQVPDAEKYAGRVDLVEIDDFVRRCAMNFRAQNEQLRF